MERSPNSEDFVWLAVSVPIASFAVPFAREFAESYPFPPPTTVYGMLLSYVGETNRLQYEGSEILVAVTSLAAPSVILRKTRRVKSTDLNSKENSRPDYQTLLSGMNFIVGVRDRARSRGDGLDDQIRHAYSHPSAVQRFGGLSCGESHNLVDTVDVLEWCEIVHRYGDAEVWMLAPDADGEWSVPVWVDHVGSSGTVWARASFRTASVAIMSKGFVISSTSQIA